MWAGRVAAVSGQPASICNRMVEARTTLRRSRGVQCGARRRLSVCVERAGAHEQSHEAEARTGRGMCWADMIEQKLAATHVPAAIERIATYGRRRRHVLDPGTHDGMARWLATDVRLGRALCCEITSASSAWSRDPSSPRAVRRPYIHAREGEEQLVAYGPYGSRKSHGPPRGDATKISQTVGKRLNEGIGILAFMNLQRLTADRGRPPCIADRRIQCFFSPHFDHLQLTSFQKSSPPRLQKPSI